MASNSNRGRKSHNFYGELNFLNKKLDNGRNAAQCTICKALLKNTSISRLRTHRKRCLAYSDDTDETESVCSIVYRDKSDEEVEVKSAEPPTSVPIMLVEKLGPTVLPLNEGIFTDNNNNDNQIVVEAEALNQPFIIANNDEIMSEDHSFKTKQNDTSFFGIEETETLISLPSTSSISSLSTSTTSTPNIEKIIKSTPKKMKKSNSKKINSFIDTITSKSKGDIDIALAKLFFGCNIPFSVIESDHFKNFIRTIRPAYAPPCRKTLSTTLLNKINEEMVTTNKQFMSKETSLLMDGWKNSSNNTNNVVTMLQTVGGKSMFLESYDFSNERETGESLETVCEKSIQLAKDRYSCDIYAVVSDNAANMLKMGRLTSLWHSTCSSHTGNLFAKDLICKDLMVKLSSVLNEFKHTDHENSLVKNGGSKIVSPAETRWCSHRDSCNSFLKNLPIMKKVVAEGIKVKPAVTYLLYDDDFIKEITNTISVLDPICELIIKCQSSDFSIADSTEEWLTISNKLPKTETIKTALARRIKMGTNIYSLTANFLHPLYRGMKLNSEQLNCIQDFLLESLDSEGLDGLNAFEHNTDIFQKLFEKKVTSPYTFWGLAEKKYPTLSNLAQKLLRIPASSAQLERIFSNWSFVHSRLRNRLTRDKSKKLIFVYYSLKLRDSNRSDDY